MKVLNALMIALSLGSAMAHAEVRQSAADSFFISFSDPISATPARAWASLAQVQLWWSGDHTWSGKAANLSLSPVAGGCFCERWKDGSVEHGRVIMALPDKLLRLDSALGPLQEFALKGILSFWIRTGDDGATSISVEYRVNGSSTSGLDQLAPQVDEVLGAQVARLVRYIDSGNPEVSANPTEPLKGSDARATILDQWAQQAAQEQAAGRQGASKSGNAKPAKKP